MKLAVVIIVVTLEVLYSNADTQSTNVDAREIVRGLGHRHLVKRHDDSKPDFRSRTVDPDVMLKLAETKLGPAGNRIRRDESDISRDLESAQLETAEAAIDAEEARDRSLDALRVSEKLSQAIGNGAKGSGNKHGGSQSKTSTKLTGSSSKNNSENDTEVIEIDEEEDYDDDEEPEGDEEEEESSSTQRSQNNGKAISRNAVNTAEKVDEGEYYDDEDDARAKETIVEDEVVTVKTLEVDIPAKPRTKPKPKSKPQPQSTESTTIKPVPKEETTPTTTPIDTGVCQGLLDLKTMSDDFRSRLKSLIEREEQVVERLEQLESQRQQEQSRVQQSQGSDTGDIQPSKACVYIEENVQVGDATKTNTFRSGQIKKPQPPPESPDITNEETLQQQEKTSKVHVYTTKGVVPEPQYPQQYPQPQSPEQYPLPQSPEQPQPLESELNTQPQQPEIARVPIIEARVHTPPDNPRVRRVHKKRRKVARQAEGQQVPTKKGNHLSEAGDIDLENIYWIKTAELASSESGRNVLEQIYKNGQDVLIIPISSKFRSIRDVANSFLDSVRSKRNAHHKNKIKQKAKETKDKFEQWWNKGKEKPAEVTPTIIADKKNIVKREESDRFKLTIRRV